MTSIIKLPIMESAFRDIAAGKLDPAEAIAIKPED